MGRLPKATDPDLCKRLHDSHSGSPFFPRPDPRKVEPTLPLPLIPTLTLTLIPTLTLALTLTLTLSPLTWKSGIWMAADQL